jgi:hypothetical protein
LNFEHGVVTTNKRAARISKRQLANPDLPGWTLARSPRFRGLKREPSDRQ